MARKTFDCRDWPGPCTLAMSGTEEEVVETQLRHVLHSHGLAGSPRLRDQIRASLKDEDPAFAISAGRAGAL